MSLTSPRSVVGHGLVYAGLSLLLLACGSETITGTGDPGETSSECSYDSDCAYRDTDGDRCTTAACESGRCVEKLVTGTPECQCHTAGDCTYYTAKSCMEIGCEAHQCVKHVLPAGPAPTQKPGDCFAEVCDGASEEAIRHFDAEDLGEDDPCVVESCDAARGLVKTNVANGTACGDGSVCFEGKCLACKPQNPTSCGGEGPGEPQNDASSTPASFPQFTPFCAFTSGTDIDWYAFRAKDEDLTRDVFDLELWSTAPSLEVCVYVKCDSGTPSGGCASKQIGPNGSFGCCWTGEPSSLKPYWDLDCTGTNEDSGTAYVSVRAPGASACEPYAIVGGY